MESTTLLLNLMDWTADVLRTCGDATSAEQLEEIIKSHGDSLENMTAFLLNSNATSSFTSNTLMSLTAIGVGLSDGLFTAESTLWNFRLWDWAFNFLLDVGDITSANQLDLVKRNYLRSRRLRTYFIVPEEYGGLTGSVSELLAILGFDLTIGLKRIFLEQKLCHLPRGYVQMLKRILKKYPNSISFDKTDWGIKTVISWLGHSDEDNTDKDNDEVKPDEGNLDVDNLDVDNLDVDKFELAEGDFNEVVEIGTDKDALDEDELIRKP